MIRAILFDVDGVLIHPWRFKAWLERERGITPAMTALFFRGPFVECAEGRADLVEVLPPFLASWAWRGSTTEFVEQWFAVENAPDENVLAIVAAIRATGLPCHVASTQERRRAEFITTSMGFGRLFDRLFFSHALGFEKPKAGFYAAVVSELGLPAEELLFFDDAAANVAAARVSGWNAERFTDAVTLGRDVRKYLGLAGRRTHD